MSTSTKPNRVRTAPYSQRFSEEELTAFRRASKQAGLSLSGWIRLHLRAAATRELADSSLFSGEK